ncbi:MAG TPA: right-handed parallel beta-helix repeat-containing protein [Pyrinomonadaceae bacterium]|nr:right-handed parallel beta-helix repeat-containing protein [Pyrinomonadaceae bacterium]
MRAMITAILTCAVLAASTPAAFAQGRTRTTSGGGVNTSSAPAARLCRTASLAMPGADIGAKINACDAALGAGGAGGEIHVNGGGTISTYVNLSRGRTLWFHAGTYTLHQAFTGNPSQDIQTELGMIRYRDDVTIKGDGWESIIVEPPITNRPTVFAPYISSVLTDGGYFHGVTRNVAIRDLQIKGQQKAASNGTYSTIEIGNTHWMVVENVFLNQTTGNGITAGGSAQSASPGGCRGAGVERECASGIVMRNNRLFQVQNQGLNVVNGRDVQIVNNVIKDHNRLSGSNGAGIDIETNTVSDTAQDIRIEGNMLDFSNSPQPFAGNGINVQSSGQADYGPVEVRNNTLIGSALTPGLQAHMVYGIFVSAGTRKVTVANNKIQRTTNCGIIAYGSEHVIQDNELTGVSGGGNIAISLMGVKNSRVSRNKVKIHPAAHGTSDLIAEMPDTGANNNIFEENIADTPPRIVGAASKIASHRRWGSAAR